MDKKQLFYLDPYGPSRGVRSVYAALVLGLDFSIANLLILVYYRKYFKMRYQSLGRDKVDMQGFKFVQLCNRIQTDGCSCGVYCLKVCV